MMPIKMQRTFYPIGQGAFYGEHFDFEGNYFNMVYDCGSAKNIKTEQPKIIDQVVEGFYPNQDVDILFISHFDDDHVNKIHILKKNRAIKRVVMPLLKQNHKTFLITINKILGNNAVVELLENPQRFFGNETKLTYVKPITLEDNARENEEGFNIIELDNLPPEIPSGTKLNFSNQNTSVQKPIWVYVPYNYEFTSRSQSFESLLKQSKIDLNKISEGDKDVIKEIRKIYKESGNINENSLLLFSNTYNNYNIRHYSYWHDRNDRDWYIINLIKHIVTYELYEQRCGCVYTGDATLSKIRSDKNFFNLINSENYHGIGTVQVAHHGALSSFDIDFFKNITKPPLFCPISFGLFNTYKHPSNNVLQQLLSEKYTPIMVTERKDSIFIQTFFLYG